MIYLAILLIRKRKTMYLKRMLQANFTLIFLLCTYNILLAQNVRISNLDYPNEPSIAMDPKNPSMLVAGANLNNYYISRDSGHTWTTANLTSSYGVWGDPVIAVDTSGDFYFFHLSNPPSGNWIDRIVCQKTTDQGITWSDGSYTGLNGKKAQDKHWCAVDRSNNHMYLTWTQFDNYGSSSPVDSSIILFSKSLDAGQSWTAPKRISKTAGDCLDQDNTVEGAVPAVGPNGEIYVSWAGPRGLVFNKSTDQGDHWLEEELDITSILGGWDFAIPGIFRANGLPVTACDVSNGPYRGTIYVNWTDQRNGETNTDVWLVKSNDGGTSWSDPVRVNDDEGENQQFFTWMTIDQTNGNLYFVFYDRRNYEGDTTDVYMTLSTDGGQTFINRKISEEPFVPNQDIFFGDYTNVTVHNGIVRPIWTRLHNGELSVWTHLMREADFFKSTATVDQSTETDAGFENYPNPSSDLTYVSFKLHQHATVNLYLEDVNGRILAKFIDNEKLPYGKYVECISIAELNLAVGSYFIRLDIDGKTKIRKIIIN